MPGIDILMALTAGERVKRYALKHPDRIKANNAKRVHKEIYARDKERMSLDPRAYLLRNAVKRARAKNRECSITVDDITIPTHCPILGLELVTFANNGPLPNSMSLDRIDNDLGYVPGNVIVVSYRANTLKKDATVEELEAIVNFYKKERQINCPKS